MTELVDVSYFRDHGHCTDEEKDECLELLRRVFRLWGTMFNEGRLVVFEIADKEPDPFFRTCLNEFADVLWKTDEDIEVRPETLRRIYAQYIAGARFQGEELLRALIIAEGLPLLLGCDIFEDSFGYWTWEDRLSWAVRGWFGADYRDRVLALLNEEKWKEARKRRSKVSEVPEFDQILEMETDPDRRASLRDWIRDGVSSHTLALALKCAAVKTEDFFLEGLDQERRDKCQLIQECVSRVMDSGAAQREMLERAKSWPGRAECT